jgi:hypothetical protein
MEDTMKTLKTGLMALSILALSSAAMAHGHGRGGYGHYYGRHEQVRRVIVEQRYEPRCERAERVVYVPERVVLRRPAVVIQPGVQVQIAFGF